MIDVDHPNYDFVAEDIAVELPATATAAAAVAAQVVQVSVAA
jgi:isoprenylcysteine carboxyl methyltransferase (ICMT) family protein YpbQ